MRLADLSIDDNTRQALPVHEVIANGASNAAIILPPTPTNTGTSIGSPNAITNGVLMDDDEDEFLQAETSPFDIDDAFEFHKANFTGKKTKPRQPAVSIAALPKSKAKPVASNPVEVFLDSNGNEYEYLGQFDGNTDFLDEKYKGVVTKAGDHLYRMQVGAQFDGQAQFEYFIGDDPETSAIFGKLFKGIGKAFKKVGKFAGRNLKKGFKFVKKALPYALPGAGAGIAASFLFKDNYTGDHYEYVGQSNGDLSFLSEVEPGVDVPLGAHLYRVQRTEAFDGDLAEFDYYIGDHPDYSNGIGGFFKKIGKGIGKAAKAVGKGVGKAVKAVGKGAKNLGKFTVKKVLPMLTGGQVASADESNGVVPTYSPTAGFEHLGNGGGYAPDYGEGMQTMYNDGSNIDTSNLAAANTMMQQQQTPAPQSNKTLTYVLIAAAVLGVIFYLKKNK